MMLSALFNGISDSHHCFLNTPLPPRKDSIGGVANLPSEDMLRFIDALIQCKNTIADLSRLEVGQGLTVDFHPAVDHIDLGE